MHDLTLIFAALRRLRQPASGLINGEPILDGFGVIGKIFSRIQKIRRCVAAREVADRAYSSKTLSKSEAFTTPTILPPF